MEKRKKQKKAEQKQLLGRSAELSKIETCLNVGRNLLLEGPVGVGKTHLVIEALKAQKKGYIRVDGDSRYSEQKLTGWFDPPQVLKNGYTFKTFIEGPLVQAMRSGSVLFINELNRMPEGVQNILLPAIDEGLIVLPKLGMVQAKPGFLVIATQNPKEFVATSHLSEALLDRFEWLYLDYQTQAEEIDIVKDFLRGKVKSLNPVFVFWSVLLVRLTRTHEKVRRGASVRAAISIAELAQALSTSGLQNAEAFKIAAQMALPTRIELEPEAENESALQAFESLLNQWLKEITSQSTSIEPIEKKKK